jgi:sulfoxide reductase catalytic subunit YedY
MAQPWNLPEREATPEAAVVTRRRWLRYLGLAGALIGAGGGLWWWKYGGSDDSVLARGRVGALDDGLYPAAPNAQFSELDRPLTTEGSAARYCNFYEFSSGKQVWRQIDSFSPLPWTLTLSGLVARPRTYDLDDLLHAFPLEERLYRHRCVEAWAMAIPWSGFPLAALLREAEPLPSARFVRFVSFDRPAEAARQRRRFEPWPYTEGLTLAEATNELAFVATGMYGHALLKQHGAPVRVVVPWKYGFKSAKSIERIELTAQQPLTFWNTLVPREYDFEANVNPGIPHPRWTQVREQMLGTGEIRPTQLYNGYARWVAHLYNT